MNEYFGPTHEEWQKQWLKAKENEALEMIDKALETYDNDIQEARMWSVIHNEDPLERNSKESREFHIRWSTKRFEMASNSFLAAVIHAAAHAAGD